MPTGYTVSQNQFTPIVIGGPVSLNPIAEVVAQDVSGVMQPGTILGRVNLSTTGTAAISVSGAGNTGNGTCTMDASQPCQLGARPGVYTVNFTGATAGYVTDPAGIQIGQPFTSLPNPWTQQIKFVVAAGGTAFVNGDKFTITIPGIVQSNGTHAGSGVITMDASTPVLYGAKSGLYSINFTGAAAGYVLDPNGNLVGPAFTSLPSPWSNELKFTVTGTPQAGDVSYVFVTGGSGKLKRFVSTNFDGSHIPVYVLLGNPLDATGGDVNVGIPGTPGCGGSQLLKVGTVNAQALLLQNEPLQSYIPLLNMKVIDALMLAGITVQATELHSYFEA